MRSIEEVRGNCVIDGGHWIWKGAMSNDGPNIHAPDYTTQSGKLVCQRGPRAVWHLKTKKPIPQGYRVFRTCEEKGCVNPAHVKCVPHKQWGEEMARTGRFKGNPKKIIANRRTGRKRSHLTPEKIAIVLYSDKTVRELARELGLCRVTISRLRTGKATAFTPLGSPFAGLA